MKHILTLLISVFVFFTNSNGQKVFNEGVIEYDLTVEPSGDQEGVVQYTGTYIITVKGNMVRRELRLSNGFGDITIQNENDKSIHSLRSTGNRNYAIQLDYNNVVYLKRHYEGYELKKESGKDEIAGYKVFNGVITYRDGSNTDISYTKELRPAAFVFEKFPNIDVLPLAFVYKSEGGTQMLFKAKSVKIEPVESGLFRIPTGYKLISYEEYQKIN